MRKGRRGKDASGRKWERKRQNVGNVPFWKPGKKGLYFFVLKRCNFIYISKIPPPKQDQKRDFSKRHKKFLSFRFFTFKGVPNAVKSIFKPLLQKNGNI